MSLWLGILIVVTVNAVAITVMLLVRRRAPQGGYYEDMQQAGWVYSVAGTAFAVILAFVFLLTFQSFDRARTSASAEADAVLSLFHIADQFHAAERDALQADLVCYGRSVVNLEWRTLDSNEQSPVTRTWALALDRDFNIAFVWLFADPAERTFAQAALPVGVTTVVAAGLVLVAFFDAPYHDTPGAVRPTSMERQLQVLDADLHGRVQLPCDAQGRPT